HLAVAINVVQQHELAHQLVVVGRHVLAEQAKLRRAVPLLDIAEHLVVSAIFLDDVDAVLDRARAAGLRGDRVERRHIADHPGVGARLLGVFPDGAVGYRAALMVCSPAPLAASSTLTFVELAHATKSRLPSGDRTISVGCASVAHSAVTLLVSRSTTATAARF